MCVLKLTEIRFKGSQNAINQKNTLFYKNIENFSLILLVKITCFYGRQIEIK